MYWTLNEAPSQEFFINQTILLASWLPLWLWRKILPNTPWDPPLNENLVFTRKKFTASDLDAIMVELVKCTKTIMPMVATNTSESFFKLLNFLYMQFTFYENFFRSKNRFWETQNFISILKEIQWWKINDFLHNFHFLPAFWWDIGTFHCSQWS